jgi:two-component system chemotaxis sensor kinase CheA
MEIDREAILQTFLAEAEEHLSLMEEALLALERSPEDPELVGTVFRGAHTLKGNAVSLGFVALGDFAHAVEDLLDRLRTGQLAASPALVTRLLQAIDTLRQLVADAAADTPTAPEVLPRLLERLAAAESAPAASLQLWPGRPRAEGRSAAERSHTLRVDAARLDRMMDLTGEIAIARGRLQQLMEDAGALELLEVHRESDRLYLDLQELVMRARMVPVGPVFRQYARTVRDVAVAHGKQARLVVEGGEVEVDTALLEQLRDPLTHMLRNALDHGIEPPSLRRARGKDLCGTIRLCAVREAGNIVIELADDGAGLDVRRIAERAHARVPATESERPSEADARRLIFEPGFSTAERVTDLSGRGVGLDVVRRNVDALRGSVSVASRPGEGTTFTIRLPLTLAIIDGFGVGVGDETYVVPMDSVIECVELPESESRHEARGVINLRGEALPYLRLRHHFGLGGEAADRENLLVVQGEGGQAGLAVDALLGERQTVIKPLGVLFRGLTGISGSAVLGNGRVALILDVPALFRQALGRGSERLAVGGRT